MIACVISNYELARADGKPQNLIMLALLMLQILMNVLLTPVDVVKPVITVKDHFTVTVIKDMNCLMIKEHVQT